jgi:hypothetical protein
MRIDFTDPAQAAMWRRMVAVLIEHKTAMGLAHWSDQKVADNAPAVFGELMRKCVELGEERAKQAFPWFMSHCVGEIMGGAPIDSLH